MSWKQRNPKSLIIVLLIMALSAGFAAAHDSGPPHTHDAGDENCQDNDPVEASVASIDGIDLGDFTGLPANHPPVAILIVGADGEVYSWQWLWRHLQTTTATGVDGAPQTYSHSHQHTHSHTHEHSHLDANSRSQHHAEISSRPHTHRHAHSHSHEHAHRVGIPHACQHQAEPGDEAIPAQSSSTID